MMANAVIAMQSAVPGSGLKRAGGSASATASDALLPSVFRASTIESVVHTNHFKLPLQTDYLRSRPATTRR
jgi:hypothetical protein